MSLSDSQTAEPHLSFEEFLEQNHAKIEGNFSAFIEPILEVVDTLHQQGSIHGGIHPGALRFEPAGKLDTDFFRERHRTADSTFDPGIPKPFLAPETLDGSGEDIRTDSYALGALIWYIVTGSPPAPASRRAAQNIQLMAAHYPRWKPSVIEAANGCLHLAKHERVKDMQELRNVLTRGLPTSVRVIFRPTAEGGSIYVREKIGDSSRRTEAVGGLGDDQVNEPTAKTLTPEPAGEASTQNEAQTETQSAKHRLESARPSPSIDPPVKLQIRDRLPNASVGKPFRQNLRELFGGQIDRVTAIAIALPENSGLIFDEAESVLHGTPTTSDELKLVISYRLAGSQPEGPALTHTVGLTVNPDPSSLWKNLPSDKNGAFAKPDTDSAFLVTLHLTVMAASRRGRSHAHEGKYREDDFGLHFIEATGWHILMLADGAGSAKFSRRGSQLACQTALAVIEEKLGDEKNQLNTALSKLGASHEAADLEKLRQLSYNVLMLAAHQAHSAIQKQAKESQATPRDFASTFIVVIARRVESRWFFASFAIGDGGAGALLEDGTLLSLTSPDSGDFAGQTVFITMPQIFSDPAALLARTHAAFCPGFKFLAAMSDGITDPIFQSDANLANSTEWEKWRQQLAQIVSLEAPTPGMEAALLDYLNFPSPGNHDDRTLLIAVPTPAKT